MPENVDLKILAELLRDLDQRSPEEVKKFEHPMLFMVAVELYQNKTKRLPDQPEIGTEPLNNMHKKAIQEMIDYRRRS